MTNITSNGENFDVLKTIKIMLNGSEQNAHLCSNNEIYIQNLKGQWVSNRNLIDVQPYGNFLDIQEALNQAELEFSKSAE